MRNRLGRLLICASLFVTPCWANEIDYFCLFTNAAAAQADSGVGRFWNAAASTWDLSRTFPGTKVTTAQAIVNGVSTLTGFWIIVSAVGADALLDADTACVMKLDRDAAAKSQSFVLAAAITGSNRTNLTFSPAPQGPGYPQPLGQ